MKILVLGSSGMLGHKMVERIQRGYENVVGLSRENGLDARDLIRTENTLRLVRPNVVINCVGVVKQRAQDPEELIAVNSLFPLFLRRVCNELNTRLIHFSTDCVFSGKKGQYTESDQPDPEDGYGLTKYMGEFIEKNCLVLRTSIIGREKKNYFGLLEWFLRLGTEPVQIQGYENAIFSGVTTNWLANTTAWLLNCPNLSGIYQVASFPVSKYHLLQMFRTVYGRYNVEINPVDLPIPCDRSLKGNKFREATRISTPDLMELLVAQREQDKDKYALQG